MDYTSSKKAILKRFPDWKECFLEEQQVFVVDTDKINRQFIVQYHEESWWLRFSEPNSGYITETLDELFNVIDKIIGDKNINCCRLP